MKILLKETKDVIICNHWTTEFLPWDTELISQLMEMYASDFWILDGLRHLVIKHVAHLRIG